MQKRRILITGAGGFVGGWVRQALAPLADEGSVEIVGPQNEVRLDVTDRAALAAAIREAQPHAVIHLAAIAAPSEARKQPDHAWEVNVDGTINLARAILDSTPRATLIFASSSEVYGESFREQHVPLNELALLQPTTFYGASKAAADLLLGQLAHEGLRVVRFRPFNHTGPGQLSNFLIPSLAEQVARIEAGLQAPVLKVGNLDVRRDFLDVRDVVRAYVDAALCAVDLPRASVFNLASSSPIGVGEIIDWFCRQSTVEISVEQDPALMRPGEIQTVSGSFRKAENELGWRPEFPIERTLEQMLRAARFAPTASAAR